MHLVIFEGNRWSAFAPLALGRPVFTLRSGTSTLLERQVRQVNPTRLTLWVRPELADWTRQHVVPSLKVPTTVNTPLDDEPALLTSARRLALGRFVPPHDYCVMLDEGGVHTVKRAYVKAPGLSPEGAMTRSPSWLKILDLAPEEPDGRTAQHVWDLINWNEEALVEDSINLAPVQTLKPGPYHVLYEQTLYLLGEVDLAPGCVLDARKGPVIIDHGVSIGANAVVQGPCYIGAMTEISPLAHIRPGTSIGPVCKVGGEVSNSLLQGYVNKPHAGFLGDSYIGEFVNLGAGTNVGNLKNTYGLVTVEVGPHKYETNRRFVGAVVGDHAKTAVGTRFSAGSYVGYGSMVAHSAPPKFVPSLTFLTDDGPHPYRKEKLAEVMQQVFQRRALAFDDIDARVLEYVGAIAKQVEG